MHYNCIRLYTAGGFQVKSIQMDGQFEGIQDKLRDQGPWINITSRDELVPKAGRYIHTITERVRCVYNTLPFKNYQPG